MKSILLLSSIIVFLAGLWNMPAIAGTARLTYEGVLSLSSGPDSPGLHGKTFKLDLEINTTPVFISSSVAGDFYQIPILNVTFEVGGFAGTPRPGLILRIIDRPPTETTDQWQMTQPFDFLGFSFSLGNIFTFPANRFSGGQDLQPFTTADVFSFGQGLIPGSTNYNVVNPSLLLVPIQPFILTKIADTNTAIPGGIGNFTIISEASPAISGPSVVFMGFGSSGQQGVYLEKRGVLEVVANTNTAQPGASGNFTTFIGASLAGANVGFRAFGSSGRQGFYTKIGGSFTKIADSNTPIPAGTGNFTGFGLGSLDGTNLAFSGSGTSDVGIYAGSGGSLSIVANNTTTIPGGTGTFSGFGDPSFDNGIAAFLGFGPSVQRGIYTAFAGTAAHIADKNTPIPGGTGNFVSFGQPAKRNGKIVFSGQGSSEQAGIYRGSGGVLSVVADKTSPVPGTASSFFTFGSSSVDGENVTFFAETLSGIEGIYTHSGGILKKVVAEGDSLDGKTVDRLFFGKEGLNGNSVAFIVRFTDASRAVYVASVDSDGDTVPDFRDNCPNIQNTNQQDTNGNGVGDACEAFVFTKIADTNTAVPGGTGNFRSVGQAAIDGENIAFWGSSGSSLPANGVYKKTGGVLSLVANHLTSIPVAGGKFSYTVALPSLDGTNVAFLGHGIGSDGAFRQGIYREIGGVLSRVADNRTTVPVAGGTFIGIGNVSSFDSGRVVFFGQGAAVKKVTACWPRSGGCRTYYYTSYVNGIYKQESGVLGRVASDTTSIPPVGGNFTSFGLSATEGGEIVFAGFFPNGIYKHSGTVLSKVVDSTDTVPSTGERFTFVSAPSIDAGNVAFHGQAPSSYGIYKKFGGVLSTVVDTTSDIPVMGGKFDGFGAPAFDANKVAFSAYGTSSTGAYIHGIFLEIGGLLMKVIGTGDSLEGKTVRYLGLGREGLSGNSLAFEAIFTDGSRGIFLSTLNPVAVGSPTPPSNCPASPDADGDGIGDACDVDIDGDGIANLIDGEIINGAFVDQSGTPSSKFTDQHLGGTSFGSIITRGDVLVGITDEVDPQVGLRISGFGGVDFAEVDACGSLLRVTNGDSLRVTCGSLKIEALGDQVEIFEPLVNNDVILMVPGGAITTITKPVPGQLQVETPPESPAPIDLLLGDETLVTISPAVTAIVTELANGQFQIDNSPNSLAPLTVEVGGQVTEIVPGASGVTDSQGPVTTAALANPNPVSVGSQIVFSANVNDSTKGGSNIVRAEYTVDSGNVVMMAAQDGAFNTVNENVVAVVPAFTNAGVHEVCVDGTDVAGNIGTPECILLAVFDPSAGFVTGGGWINSPAGAFAPNSMLIGKANFGFVSKYQKGAKTPIGVTEFQFKVAELNFHSEDYQWLVVSGARAQFKGTGIINGVGNYGFLLTAIDGQISGGGGVDKFRIKIWEEASGIIIYDNKLGSNDFGNDATELGGGSIVIHAK